jgi:hypothetical protein
VPLTKFSDHIRAIADRGFLAKCHCTGDVCECEDFNPPYAPIHAPLHAKATNPGNSQMPNILNTISAAERSKMADAILAASESMTVDEKRDLVKNLSVILEVEAKAQAKTDRKKTAIANIAAAKSGSLGERAAINMLEGNFKRAGISLDEIVEAPEKIDQIFAAAGSRLSVENRMGAKGLLFRLGVISQ